MRKAYTLTQQQRKVLTASLDCTFGSLDDGTLATGKP
jgi:hypothetical protein